MHYNLLYAILAVIWLALAAGLWLWQHHLRTIMLIVGCAGGVLEVLAEYWYLQDYWHPATLLGFPALEDFVYGFGLSAFTVAIGPVILRDRYSAANRGWRMQATLYIVYLLVFGALMQAGMHYDRLPSIWMASILFVVTGLVGCGLAYYVPRALGTALIAGAVLGVMSLCGYALALNVLVDGDAYLRQVYLLAGSAWDVRVMGNVPLDEVAWNVARAFGLVGMFVAVSDRDQVPRV